MILIHIMKSDNVDIFYTCEILEIREMLYTITAALRLLLILVEMYKYNQVKRLTPDGTPLYVAQQ